LRSEVRAVAVKRSKGGLTGRQKAAIVLVALGPELSAKILSYLDEEQIEEITMEIATMGKIPTATIHSVLQEFYHSALAREYLAFGGIEYAKEVLEKALGAQKAMEIISRLTVSLKATPFEFVRHAAPEQLLSFLESEHPQTIALVLAHLEPAKAAALLSALPQELQTEVAMRMAIMEGTNPNVVREVERELERRMSTAGNQETTAAGGIKSLVDILNNVDRATEKAILERLEEESPAIAEEVSNMLFVFEDIILLDDRAIQLVLRDIDQKDLALALKGASDEVKEKIFKNMSTRAATMLQEDMEFMGPVRLRNVEEAQQRIVATIRRLEEAGEIVVSRGQGDEIVV